MENDTSGTLPQAALASELEPADHDRERRQRSDR
jgi:hypothetical protein